jgi:hypothetical protein
MRLASSAWARGSFAHEQLITQQLQLRHLRHGLGQPFLFSRQFPLGRVRLSQGFHRLPMQRPSLLGMPTLVVQPSDEHLVGSVSEVHRRQDHHSLPVFAAGDNHCRQRAGSARHHETGAAPQEVVTPGLEHRPLRGHPHRTGDERRIDQEVGTNRAHQWSGQPDRFRRRQETAKGLVRETARGHRDGRRRHAEQRPVQRRWLRRPIVALRPGPGHGSDDRMLRPEQQQRHQVR